MRLNYLKIVGNKNATNFTDGKLVTEILLEDLNVLTFKEMEGEPVNANTIIRRCCAYIVFILPFEEEFDDLVKRQIESAVNVCKDSEVELVIFSEWEIINEDKVEALMSWGVSPNSIYNGLYDVVEHLNKSCA